MDWVRLGQMALARRVQLGIFTREQFAIASGMSSRLLLDIEHARRTSYDPATLARLEQALGWQPGSAERVLAGGEPLLIPGTVGAELDGDDAGLNDIIAQIESSGLPEPLVKSMAEMTRELHRRNRQALEDLRRRQEMELRGQLQVMLNAARDTMPGADSVSGHVDDGGK